MSPGERHRDDGKKRICIHACMHACVCVSETAAFAWQLQTNFLASRGVNKSPWRVCVLYIYAIDVHRAHARAFNPR